MADPAESGFFLARSVRNKASPSRLVLNPRYTPGESEPAETSGPRFYYLFPLLCGTIKDWHGELPRIAGMKFDRIFVNPFHLPGFSGSLYAVKDYYRYNPLIVPDGYGHWRSHRHVVRGTHAM